MVTPSWISNRRSDIMDLVDFTVFCDWKCELTDVVSRNVHSRS